MNAIQYPPPQYNKTARDTQTLDHQETILGHLLSEKQYSLKDSLYYLTSYAKEETKAWDTTETIASGGRWVGLASGGAAYLAAGAGPVGLFFGVVIAAIGSGGSWWLKDTADRVGALRRTEFELHKNYPQMRETLWQMHQQGATSAEIVAIYDRMVFHLFANGIPSDITTVLGLMGTQPNSNVFKEMEDLSMVTGSDLDPSIAVMTAPSTAQTELQPIEAVAHSMHGLSNISGGASVEKASEPNYLARIWQVIDRNKNFFVGGQPGSGKGVMVSNLIRRKLDQYPGSIAVWLDPKGSPREDGNFSDPRITRLKMSGVGMSRAEYAIEVAEILETARSFVKKCDIENGKRVWIVFDEIMNLKQKLNKDLFGEVQDLLVDCISMGDDQGLHTVALTQSFNAGDTVGSDELLKNLALIACFKEDDFPRAKKLVQYGKTNHESYSVEEFSRLVRKSPRDRVICIGGTFIPAPEMPLLSGWDRDKGAKTTSSQPPKTATFQTIAVQQEPDDFEDLPDFFKTMAIIALNTQTASDRSIITNDLTHAQNAAKAMRVAADNGDNAKFEENKTILTDRIKRLKNNV